MVFGYVNAAKALFECDDILKKLHCTLKLFGQNGSIEGCDDSDPTCRYELSRGCRHREEIHFQLDLEYCLPHLGLHWLMY